MKEALQVYKRLLFTIKLSDEIIIQGWGTTRV